MFGMSKTMYYNASVIHLSLEREYLKILKSHVNNSSYFEISACLFQAPTCNKCRTLKLRN